MTGYYYQPLLLTASVGGMNLDNVLSAQISHGYEQGIASCTVELPEPVNLGGYYGNLVVSAGAGGPIGPAGFQTRFNGLVTRQRYNMWPPTYSVVGRGNLFAAQQYTQPKGYPELGSLLGSIGVPGKFLFEILGITPSSDPDAATAVFGGSDADIIAAVLSEAGVAGGLDILGTGYLFGGLAWEELTWRARQSALSYISQFDQVCLGYRTFDTPDGTVARRQIYGSPSDFGGFYSAIPAFTEGVDIWDLSTDRDQEDFANGVAVQGYVGDNIGSGLIFYKSGGPIFRELSSNLICGVNDTSPYLPPSAVGNWLLTELDREQVNVRLVTYRDDLIKPGDQITVNSFHGGATQPLWVRNVHLNIRANPMTFEQQIDASGGNY